MATNPRKSTVIVPITITTLKATSESSNSGDMRATMNTPAVTMVAAWIRAEIGVGPSIESGNQTCSGTCADLPMAPINNKMQMMVIRFHSFPGITSTPVLATCGAMANTAA